MRRRTLTTRITLSHLLATLVSIVLLGGSLLGLIGRSQRTQMLANLQAQAEVYATYALTLANDTNTLAAQAPAIVARFPTTNDIAVRIFALNGSPLLNSPLGQFPSRPVRPFIRNNLILPPVGEVKDRRYVAQPIRLNEQIIGIVEVSQSLEREYNLSHDLRLTLLVAGLIGLVGAFGLGIILARTLTRPLHQLGHVARAIASGDLAVRSPDRSPDEIGQLAMQINTMAADLESRIGQVESLAATRQEFYRRVSHELRTPLTAIRGVAENLEDDATPEQQAALQVIQTETARLQRLVNELLEPGEHQLVPLRQRKPLDLQSLISECTTLLQPRAIRSGIELITSMQGSVTVSGDRDRLKQAVLNVLDNALKWTPPGGTISVLMSRTAHEVSIMIRDTGPGIPPELGERVWERGVHGPQGGQGYGLTLVREVVEAHQGRAEIEPAPGTNLRLTLPVFRG